MASILDRYGIKEVADVTFYKIEENGSRGVPVLYLDTLKVSTIEQTAETADARGGKGNPKLITWDYGKEITVTLEDALFSAKSMAIMFGNGIASEKVTSTITRTVAARLIAGTKQPGGTSIAKIDYLTADVYDSNEGAARKKVDMINTSTARDGMILFANSGLNVIGVTDESGTALSDSTTNDSWTLLDIQGAVEDLAVGSKVFITYTYAAAVSTVVVSGDSFPGTYYITGDTYARSDITGMDQFFQFIIPKAKVTSENTITLEADGDPSVFNMNLTVLRPEDGEMMKLVQYDLVQG